MLLAVYSGPQKSGANGYVMQPLDNRTLGRLEAAVQKSSYVGEGKRLKVTNEVCFMTGRSSPFWHGSDTNINSG